jgi:hypothetical protein
MTQVLYVVGLEPSSNVRRDLKDLHDKGFKFAYVTMCEGKTIIQVGSFTLIENALLYRDELKAKGFDAFVKMRITT